MVLGVVAALLLLLLWLRRGLRQRDFVRALGCAPSQAKGCAGVEHTRWTTLLAGRRFHGESRVIVLRDGEPAPGQEGDVPSVDLGPTGGYRDGRSEPACAIGPGRINGLLVARGERGIVVHGDYVALGAGAAFRLELPADRDPHVLRYHLADDVDQLRLIKTEPCLAGHTAAWFVAGSAVATMVVAQLNVAWWLPATIGGLTLSLIGAAMLEPRLRRFRAGMVARESLDGARVEELEHGGYRLWAAGRSDLLEHVPPCARAPEPEIARLLTATREELEPTV